MHTLPGNPAGSTTETSQPVDVGTLISEINQQLEHIKDSDVELSSGVMARI